MIFKDQVAVFVAIYGLTLLGHRSCSAQVAPTVVEDFDQARGQVPEAWNVVSGNWHVDDGVLVADSMDADSYITFGDPSWQNYEIEVSVTFRKVRDSSRWLSVLFRAPVAGTAPWSQVPIRFESTRPNGVEFAVRTSNGWSVRKRARAKPMSKLGQARQLKVVVRGTTVEGYLDGRFVVGSHLCVDRASGCAGLGVSGCLAAFDNFNVRHLPDSPVAHSPTIKQSEIVAHRGYSAIAPENTLAAIREAIAAGSHGCEFDVRRSADGAIVVLHDATVDRTTNGKGLVKELSLEKLQKLDAGSWKDSKFQGERIPTLREALSVLKDSGCQPVIEIKVEGISQQVVNTIRDLEMVDQVAVIAFSQGVVREIRAIEPRVTCAWLCSENLDGTIAQQADWLQARARQCDAQILDVNFNMLSPALVVELKRRNLGVWTWTVNESVVMDALLQWGVDSITTDRPDLASRPTRLQAPLR